MVKLWVDGVVLGGFLVKLGVGICCGWFWLVCVYVVFVVFDIVLK